MAAHSEGSLSCLRLTFIIALFFAIGGVDASAAPPEPDASKLFKKPPHYIVEDQAVTFELNSVPLPFLDWGLVQAGTVVYVRKGTHDVLPLNGPHDLLDPEQVEAVPVAVPSGVRLRVVPATKGGTFAEELFALAHPWEENCNVHTLLFDDADKLYKVWYRTKRFFAYAESKDFKTWHRPLKEYVAYEDQRRTNILGVINAEEAAAGDLRSAAEARPGHAGAFFVDPTAPPAERYKCTFLGHLKKDTAEYARATGMPRSVMTGPGSTVLFGAVSADGIGWRVLPRPIMLHDGDTLSVARYDSLRKRYVLYTRLYELGRRTVAVAETDDFRRWPLPRNTLTPGPAEAPTVDFYSSGLAPYPGRPEIRTLMCVAYDRAVDSSEIRLATSRDGHSFHFVPGGPVIRPETTVGDGSGFVAAFPGLVRTPDGRMLIFYDAHRTPHKFPRHRFGGSRQQVAWWPADRLAAVEAKERGEFTTAPLRLRGKRIVVNLQADRTGGVEAELRDEKFRPVAGRTFAEADRLYGDRTAAVVTWKGQSDVSASVGRTVYLVFRLRGAKVYSVAAGE